MSEIVIEEVDITSWTDAEVDGFTVFANVLAAETDPDDPPTPAEVMRAQFRTIPDFIGFRFFHAKALEGRTIAAAIASWTKTDDNQHLIGVQVLSVLPEFRRRGIARRLLAEVVAVAEAEGRTLLMSNTNERVPAGRAFAERIGAQAGTVAHVNRLMLADVDRDVIRRWIEEGPVRATGYSLVAVDGRYPDDLVDKIVDLHHVMNTAPKDDLDLEDQFLSVEHFREMETMMFAAGVERWYLAARHDASGELAGFTELSWSASQPATMGQGGTAVRPEHRGHALGKWLKAAMIERVLAERPEVEDIRTGNADSNDAMLGINHQLGFKPYYENIGWQVSVDVAKAYLDES